MKTWNLYYWNKHDYKWVKIGISTGHTAYQAIRIAKAWYYDFVERNDVMKVELV